MSDRVCSIEGCNKPLLQRGWCAAHDARWRRHGDPLGGGPSRHEPGATLDEVLWLRGGGASPYEVSVALKVSALTLEREMHRLGRPDLAAWFRPEALWGQRVSA